jgi:hypothetical protein
MTSAVKMEVGNEVEAMCRPCNGPAIHVIESIKNDKIDKVLCKGCNKSHKYKPVVEEGDEKPARKTTSAVSMEAGNEVEAMCRTCKGPAIHVIESIKNDKIDKVLCKGCNKSHKYKPVGQEADVKPARKTTSAVSMDVGNEVEAMCRTCKGPAIHVIESIKNDKIDKVLCKGCNKSHKYKPVVEEGDEKPAKKTTKRAAPTKTKEERKWSRLLNKVGQDNPIDYTMSEIYNEKDVLNHGKFGIGVVHEVIDHTKISVVFKEGTKVLIQNR